MSTNNHLGNLGEDVVSLLFRRKINNRYRFSTTFLGEKGQLQDFVVHLLDENGSEYGPYFFLQVKATETISPPRRAVPARFSAQEVTQVQARKAPFYLVAVGSIDDDTEEVFAIAVDTSSSAGLSGVPRFFSLSEKEVRMQIYNEVHAHFSIRAQYFQSQLTRKAHARNFIKRGGDDEQL